MSLFGRKNDDDTNNEQGSAEEQLATEAAEAEANGEPTEPAAPEPAPEPEPIREPVLVEPSAGAIRLKHIFHEQDLIFYFHDGEAPVVGGIVAIPVEYPYWARKAYVMGYRIDAESGEELTFGEVIDAFDRAAAAAVEETPGA